MAKRNLEYAVEMIVNSLNNAMQSGTERDQLLSLYKSRLFDENLVDKDRRNQVLQAVNKAVGMDFLMRDIKNADSTLLEHALKSTNDNGPDILQGATELPELTPKHILSNRDEFSEREVLQAASIEKADNHQAEVLSQSSVETLTIIQQTQSHPKEESLMKAENDIQNAGQHINEAARNTADAIKDGAQEATEQAKAGAQQAAEEVKETIADPSFMDRVNAVRPEYLAAGAAVVGAGTTMLATDFNLFNLGGGAVGVTASYFAAKAFLSQRENNLLTKAAAVSGGLVLGAAGVRAAGFAKDYFGDTELTRDANGETVVLIKPLPTPAPVVTVEQPLF